MIEETSSEDRDVVIVEGYWDLRDAPTPLSPSARAALEKVRARYIKAGLIHDPAQPPRATDTEPPQTTPR